MSDFVLKIALTFDVEHNSSYYFEKLGEKNSGLTKAAPEVLEMLTKQRVPGTWFIAHDNENKIDQEFPSLVEKMNENGEIGCHVHFRKGSGNNSAYERSMSFQTDIIGNSTRSLREIGFDVRSFRGGAYFFDENTLRVLESLEYRTDSSVVPGLYSKPVTDLVVDHKRRLFSKPYFPSHANHCIPGNSKILEIPISICPCIRLHHKLFSFFIGRPMLICDPPDVLLRELNIISNDSMKLAQQLLPVVLSAHSYDFLINTTKQIRDLELFITTAREKMNARFVTLEDIRKEYFNKTYQCENLESLFTVTTSDVLQYVNRVPFLRKLLDYF